VGASGFRSEPECTILALTDETGNIKERYAYDAYSAPTILDAAGVELPKLVCHCVGDDVDS